MTFLKKRHLIFEKGAENAARFYQKLFAELQDKPKIKKSDKNAFILAGVKFYCTEIPDNHEFSCEKMKTGFLDIDSPKELKKIFKLLSKGGEVIVPVTEHGPEIFAWVKDALGLSWQLNYYKNKS